MFLLPFLPAAPLRGLGLEQSFLIFCKHGFYEGEDCPICEHKDGQHDVDYVGEDWDGPEYPCPLCAGYTDAEADEMLSRGEYA